MDAVHVHPLQPKELTGAEPTKPEDGICESCHGPVALGVGGHGTVEIVVEIGIKGYDMAGPKGPTGYGISDNLAFEALGELPKHGIVVKANVLLVQLP